MGESSGELPEVDGVLGGIGGPSKIDGRAVQYQAVYTVYESTDASVRDSFRVLAGTEYFCEDFLRSAMPHLPVTYAERREEFSSGLPSLAIDRAYRILRGMSRDGPFIAGRLKSLRRLEDIAVEHTGATPEWVVSKPETISVLEEGRE